MAPARPASTISRVTMPESTMPFAMVAATAIDRNAPTKLRVAARMTAALGLSARVAIEVAIALPVSWKPFVKSNAKAVATTSASRMASVTPSIVTYSGPCYTRESALDRVTFVSRAWSGACATPARCGRGSPG